MTCRMNPGAPRLHLTQRRKVHFNAPVWLNSGTLHIEGNTLTQATEIRSQHAVETQ